MSDPAELADNAQVARRFLEAMITGDSDGLEALCAPGFRIWAAGHLSISGWKDREPFLARQRAFAGGGRSPAFADAARFDLGAVTAQDDRVSIEAEIHVPLTAGGVYNNQFHFLFRVRDGLVEECKEYMDTLHVAGAFGAHVLDGDRPSNLTEVTTTYRSA